MTLKTATSAWQKIALVFLGLFLSLVLLEAGLRLGGFILSSMQAYGNFQSTKQKGAYRILCIGESTTQGQYPHLLEQALNRRNIGVRFSVIDKGRGGKTTNTLLEEIESNLTEYHPDMVVAMMGINDAMIGIRDGGRAMLTTSGRTPFIRSLKIYFLARLLWRHLQAKAKEMGFYQPAGDKPISMKVEAPPKVEIPLPETVLKETPAEPTLTEDSFKKALQLDPKYDQAYAELGRLYREQGKLAQAEDSFKKAIEINPKNNHAYVGLGWLYQDQDKLAQAEDSFKKALELNPKNDNAYVELGRLYRVQDKFPQAEDSFKKAIEINPKNNHAYVGLGWLYQDQDKLAQAEDFFKKTLELNPRNFPALFELGWLYRVQGKFPQTVDILRKLVTSAPKEKRLFRAMASLYEEMGNPALAREYAKKAAQSGFGDYAAVTVNNYRKLKGILDRKGIKLVCVQYPVRNVGPLKRIFEKDKGIIFVDNESIFKEAVRQSSYKKYFRDMFGGDFGHCTRKGNELLAQNIADVILREVFNKR